MVDGDSNEVKVELLQVTPLVAVLVTLRFLGFGAIQAWAYKVKGG